MMTDTPAAVRKDFASFLAGQPEEIRPHGRSIDQNLKILSRRELGEKDKAAALTALRDNLVKFEKMRARLRSLMPSDNPLK